MKRRFKLPQHFMSVALLAAVLASVAFGTQVNRSSRAATVLGDLNNDGIVDILDLSLLLSNWGKTSTSTTPLPRLRRLLQPM